MKPRVLALLSEDEQLKQIARKITAKNEELMERVKFLKLKIDQEVRDCSEASKKDWKELEARLREMERVPKEYNSSNDVLSLDWEENTLRWFPNGQGRVPNKMAAFLHDIFE